MEDKIYYYSKSRDVTVGNGIHEYIQNPKDYHILNNIPNFRKILSNFHVFPFKYGNYYYNTIEHAFQSEKMRLVDENIAFNFTYDAANVIGMGDGLLARKNRKLIKLNTDQLNHWNSIKDEIMKNITEEKIKQCEIYKTVLLATNSAQLWHIIMRGKPVRNIYLEQIRSKIEF